MFARALVDMLADSKEVIFRDRTDAGFRLADGLVNYLERHPKFNHRSELVVVGLPRGGVITALEVARRLECALEILTSKKLPYPGQPEYAIGAVTADGIVVTNPSLPHSPEWNAYIAEQSRELLRRTSQREQEIRRLGEHEEISLENKIVIIVDDGIATGMTALAAIESARRRKAAAIVLAVPIISLATYSELRLQCDDVVALTIPRDFAAVGQYFVNFDQVTDAAVAKALKESHSFGTGPVVHCRNTN